MNLSKSQSLITSHYKEDVNSQDMSTARAAAHLLFAGCPLTCLPCSTKPRRNPGGTGQRIPHKSPAGDSLICHAIPRKRVNHPSILVLSITVRGITVDFKTLFAVGFCFFPQYRHDKTKHEHRRCHTN
jgi:hypothetical protein